MASAQRYFLPLALDWETRGHDPAGEVRHASRSPSVRHKDRVGLIATRRSPPANSPRDIARAMVANTECSSRPRELRFSSTPLLSERCDSIVRGGRARRALEQSNTRRLLRQPGSSSRAYRRLREGVNPELEMGRFLTDVANVPAHRAGAGRASRYLEEGAPEPVTLAVMQRLRREPGRPLDAGARSTSARLLIRACDCRARRLPHESAAAGFHLGRMALLGRRVAETAPRARAADRRDCRPSTPSRVTDADLDAMERTIDASRGVDAAIECAGCGVARAADRDWRARRHATQCRSASGHVGVDGPRSILPSRKRASTATSHLGQVLVAQDDFIIVDFEGEPEPPARAPARGVLRAARRRRDAALVQLCRARSAAAPRLAAVAAPLRRVPRARALRDWERDASRTLPRGLSKAAAGLASIPRDPRRLQRGLVGSS